MDENERLSNMAAIAHVQKAQELWDGTGGRIPQVDVQHLAVMLGMVIRRLDTLNVKMDMLERILTQPRPGSSA